MTHTSAKSQRQLNVYLFLVSPWLTNIVGNGIKFGIPLSVSLTTEKASNGKETKRK
jgi:hypothetical protein